jgi:hypothetical protein
MPASSEILRHIIGQHRRPFQAMKERDGRLFPTKGLFKKET